MEVRKRGKSTPPGSFTEAQTEQAMLIKKRLKKEFDKHGDSYYALVNILSKPAYGGYSLTYNTVYKTLDAADYSTPNLFVVLGLSRYWNLDMNLLFSMPTGDEEKDVKTEVLNEYTRLGSFTPLRQKGYLGDFVGYMQNPNSPGKEDIVKFDLYLEDEPGIGRVMATLTYYIYPKDTKGEQRKNSITYSGQAYLATEKQNIIMLLTNSSGEYFFLAMNFIAHNTLPMYYRPGIAITGSAADKDVTAINLIVFENEVSDEKVATYLPGLLKFTGSHFAVERSVVKEMMEEGDEDVAFLLNEMAGYLPGKKTEKEIYWVKEKTVLTMCDELCDEDMEKVMKGLLKLKSRALGETHIEYDYVPEKTRFGKEYLQNNDKK